MVNADNTITFTPAAGFTGNATISYTISDGSRTATANVVVTIAPPPDQTPPVVSPIVTGTAGTNNWYTSNVAVSWTVADPESTIGSQTGSGLADGDAVLVGTAPRLRS